MAEVIKSIEKTEVEAIIERCVQRVVLRQEGIAVTLSLFHLLPGHEGQLAITRDIPMRIQRRGVEMRMALGESRSRRVDPRLIKTIASAHAWYQYLISGRITSFSDIAVRHHMNKADVSRIINLAFPAPDFVEDIVSGHQPADLTAHKLLRQTELPLNWEEQRRVLGFCLGT